MLTAAQPEYEVKGDKNIYLQDFSSSSRAASAPPDVTTTQVLPVLTDGQKKKKIIRIPSELRPRALYAQQSRSYFHNPLAPKTWYDFEIFPKYKLSLRKESFQQAKPAVDTILIEDYKGYIRCTIQMYDKTLKIIDTSIPTPRGGLTPENLKKIKKDVRNIIIMENTPLPDQVVEQNKIYLEVKNNYVHYTLRDKRGSVVRSVQTQIEINSAEPFVIDTLSAKIEEQVLADAESKQYINPQPRYAGYPVTNELQKATDPHNKIAFAVPEGSIGLIKFNGKPAFLAPGSYMSDWRVSIPNAGFEIVPVTQKIIKHETLHAITVLPGELVYVQDSQDVRNSKYLLPGKHFIDSATITVKQVVTPFGIFVRVPKTDAEFEAEKKYNSKAKNYINKFIRVPDGKAYVAHNDKGEKYVLDKGLHEIPPEWVVMEDSISTKVRDEVVEIFCQTQNNENVRVNATVTYQIPVSDKGMKYELVILDGDSPTYFVPGNVYITKDKNNELTYAVTAHAGWAPTYQGKLEEIVAPHPFNLAELNKLKDAIMAITHKKGHTQSFEGMTLAVTTIGPQNIDEKVKKIAKEVVAKQVKEISFNLDSRDGLKQAITSSSEQKDDAPPDYFESSLEADIGKKAVETLKKSKDICEAGIKVLNVSIHSMELTDELAKEAVAKATARKIEMQSEIQLSALKKPEVRNALVEAAAAKIIADTQHQAEMRRLQQESELAEKREAVAKQEAAALDREIELEMKKQQLAQLRAGNTAHVPASFADGARSIPVSSTTSAQTLSLLSPIYNSNNINGTTTSVTVHATSDVAANLSNR